MEIVKSESDFYISVEKALDEIDSKWRDYKGVIVLGSHAPTDIEEKIRLIKEARENNVPCLGICMGMQLMAIEYARNILGILDATSEEIGPGTPIIKKLPEMRVGIRPVVWKGKTSMESHWHHYGFNNEFYAMFGDWEMVFTDRIAEVMQLKTGHPFMVGLQFHPEYQSSKKHPHPLLANFIAACKKI